MDEIFSHSHYTLYRSCNISVSVNPVAVMCCFPPIKTSISHSGMKKKIKPVLSFLCWWHCLNFSRLQTELTKSKTCDCPWNLYSIKEVSMWVRSAAERRGAVFSVFRYTIGILSTTKLCKKWWKRTAYKSKKHNSLLETSSSSLTIHTETALHFYKRHWHWQCTKHHLC